MAAEKSNVGEATCGMNQVVTSEVDRPAGLIIGATRDCLFVAIDRRFRNVEKKVTPNNNAPDKEIIPMRVITGLLTLMMFASLLLAADAEQERLANSAEALQEILNIPDALPKELLNKAECVAVMPSVKKFALGIGGSYGRGVLVCRTGNNFTGPWGAPAAYRLEGASIGFQLGGQATDFLLLVMNPRGVESLLRSKVKLGADATVAAGPKGRAAMAATDAYMRAEILTYSRSRGLFAGVSLEGSTLRQDNKANETLYGRKITAREIVHSGRGGAGQQLVNVLQKASPRNESDASSLK